MLKTFDHYCEYRKTPNGLVLSPMQLNKWLVLFCDEINLPDMDRFGTVQNFLRLTTFFVFVFHYLVCECILMQVSFTEGFLEETFLTPSN